MKVYGGRGFTLIEVILTLGLMLLLTTAFSVAPTGRTRNDIGIFKNALTDALFSCRLKSVTPNSKVFLSADAGKKNFVIECLDNTGAVCVVRKPFGTNSVTRCSLDPFVLQYGQTFSNGKVPFERKFFIPFRVEFVINGQNKSILVDEFSNITVQ
ncbi:MAG: prepilin-type N-terminal cleavage/methylation domain-containing protein [Puniceicoccales bacterium]|jgi:prepilin-type N-terminal cleavage/methylation domain-containing protein|nr:prepilin-type N-terminal cleavage/methylation domain-containing protein [Puniceicoccales bacterium]